MEMKINGVDALTLGIRMGDKFLDVISSCVPLKPPIENKSSVINGKQVLFREMPLLDERNITLQFNIEGTSEADFISKREAFKILLYKGKVTIYVPVNNETYRLTYLDSQSYAQNANRTFCKMSVKFNEPDPTDRSNE